MNSFNDILQNTQNLNSEFIFDNTADNYNELLNLGERIGKVKIGIPVEKLESQFKQVLWNNGETKKCGGF